MPKTYAATISDLQQRGVDALKVAVATQVTSIEITRRLAQLLAGGPPTMFTRSSTVSNMTELTTSFAFALLEQQVAYAKQITDILVPAPRAKALSSVTTVTPIGVRTHGTSEDAAVVQMAIAATPFTAEAAPLTANATGMMPAPAADESALANGVDIRRSIGEPPSWMTERAIEPTAAAEVPGLELAAAQSLTTSPISEAPVAQAFTAETTIAQALTAETTMSETPTAEASVLEARGMEAAGARAAAPIAQAHVMDMPVVEAPAVEASTTEAIAQAPTVAGEFEEPSALAPPVHEVERVQTIRADEIVPTKSAPPTAKPSKTPMSSANASAKPPTPNGRGAQKRKR